MQCEVNIDVKRFRDSVLLGLPFVYYLTGPLAFVSYLLSLRALHVRFSLSGWIWLCCFLIYVSLLLFANGIVAGSYILRYYWGFLLFYLVFRSGVQLSVEKLLVFLSILTIAEAILINVFPVETFAPSYFGPPDLLHFAGLWEYKRPAGFGGNASVTSVILVSLFAISSLKRGTAFWVVVAIVASMSGSGFIALFIYFLAIAPPVLAVPFLLGMAGIIINGLIYKVSPDYISYLLDYKVQQMQSEISFDSLLLGVPLKGALGGVKAEMGGDFAFLSFISLNGMVGLALLIFFLISRTNARNWLPVFIMFVATLHYGAIYYFPGQLVLGYLLNMKRDQATELGRV